MALTCWLVELADRTIQIQAGQHAITAADPVPDELRQALQAITRPS